MKIQPNLMYLPDILTEMVGKKNLSNGNEAQGCREKKPPNCHKYATFWGGFLTFCGQKRFFFKCFSIRTEKLHSI